MFDLRKLRIHHSFSVSIPWLSPSFIRLQIDIYIVRRKMTELQRLREKKSQLEKECRSVCRMYLFSPNNFSLCTVLSSF